MPVTKICLTGLVDGSAQSTPVFMKVVDNGDGTISPVFSANISASDIEIGAVEGKDGDADNRWNIKAANTARTTGTFVLAVQHIDAAGNVLPASPVLGAGTAVIGHVIVDSGAITISNASLAVTGTFWQATQPVSAAALPLPAGAATSALQPSLGTSTAPSANVLSAQRPAVTSVTSMAVEASHVLKASAGQLVRLAVTSTAAGFILVMNSATVPADGAVALLDVPLAIAAGQTLVVDYPSPLVASIGISVCISNAASFTKAIQAATCIFQTQIN